MAIEPPYRVDEECFRFRESAIPVSGNQLIWLMDGPRRCCLYARNTAHTFSGLIYGRGLRKNSQTMAEAEEEPLPRFFFYFIFGERVVALSRVLWYVCDTFDGGKHSVFIAAIRISFVPRLVRVRLKRRCWISSFFQFARMWKGCFLGVEDFRIGRLKINYYFFWIFIYSEISFLRDRNSHIYFRCLLSILSIPFRYTVIYLILAFTFIFSANYVWDIKN